MHTHRRRSARSFRLVPALAFSAVTAAVIAFLAPPAIHAQADVDSVAGRATPEGITAPEQDAATELQAALARERSGELRIRDGERLSAKARREDDAEKRVELETKANAAFEAAVADYLAAIPIRPDVMESYVRLGEALRHLGRFGDAVKIHETALRRSPDDAGNLRGWLETLYSVGRLSDATNAYAPLATANPDRAAALLAALERLLAEKRSDGKPHPELNLLASWIAKVRSPAPATSGSAP